MEGDDRKKKPFAGESDVVSKKMRSEGFVVGKLARNIPSLAVLMLACLANEPAQSTLLQTL
jgi:hypothetical protein